MTDIVASPTLALEPAQPAANSPAAMMLSAMQHGASLEQIEKMMDLQERWERGEAKKAYDAAFAAFKAEGVEILRRKQVTDGPLVGKRYAELHDVVSAVTAALSRHGLSSSWKLTRDELDWMEVTCYLRHVAGHEEAVSMGGPPDIGKGRNAIQARASTKTYLERYTLKAITGLSEQDDDTDGVPPADAVRQSWHDKIEATRDADELRQLSRAGTQFFTKERDVAGYRWFVAAVQAHGNKLTTQEAAHAA